MSVLAIIEVKLRDGDLFQQYVQGHLSGLEASGGRIIAVSPSAEVVEGERPFDILVVQEWPSAEQFYAWYESAEYRPWRDLRQNEATEWVNAYLLPKQA